MRLDANDKCECYHLLSEHTEHGCQKCNGVGACKAFRLKEAAVPAYILPCTNCGHVGHTTFERGMWTVTCKCGRRTSNVDHGIAERQWNEREEVAKKKLAEHTLLDRAKELVYGERQKAYGHPHTNFSRICTMWSVILNRSVTIREFVLMMVTLKIARDINKPKDDNLLDIVGYVAAGELAMNAPEEYDWTQLLDDEVNIMELTDDAVWKEALRRWPVLQDVAVT